MFIDQYTHTVSLPLSTISSVKHLPPVVLEESSIRIPDGTLILGKNFSSLKVIITCTVHVQCMLHCNYLFFAAFK